MRIEASHFRYIMKISVYLLALKIYKSLLWTWELRRKNMNIQIYFSTFTAGGIYFLVTSYDTILHSCSPRKIYSNYLLHPKQYEYMSKMNINFKIISVLQQHKGNYVKKLKAHLSENIVVFWIFHSIYDGSERHKN